MNAPDRPDRPDLRPLEVAPVSVHPPYDQRRRLIWDRDASNRDFRNALYVPLAGIQLGTYDYRLIAWLAGWDHPTVGGLASLLHRARAAGPLDAGGGAR